MTFLPVLRRELVVAARRTATYRQRIIFAGLALAVVAILFLTLSMTRLTGALIFHFLSWAGFILCALEGLRATADSIALERREGTLGLLLLTDLDGRAVVIGKFGAACVQSLTTIVAILPAFTLPILLGGVTAGECWRLMLAFVGMLFFALTAGTLISTVASNTLTAFLMAFVLVLVVMIPPVTLATFSGATSPHDFVWLAGPLQMFLSVPDTIFSMNPALFWHATWACFVFCALMFVAAGYLLKNFPRLEATNADSWLQQWLRPHPGRAESWNGTTAQTSPTTWLAVRTLPGRRALWVLITLGAVICFLLGFFAGRHAVMSILACEVFFAYLIKLWLASVAPQSFNSSRRNGALELLLCTPLSPTSLVRGQVDALFGYFLAPALIVAIGFTLSGIIGMGLGHNAAGLKADSSPFMMGLFWLVSFLFDLYALAYVGLWFGLTNARVDRAIAKTVFAVLILPWLTIVVPIIGCLGMIGWPLYWTHWASRRLDRRFRHEASTVFALDEERSGWLPWSRG